MNIANKLTIFRIVISFFFLIFLFIAAPGAKTFALGLFVIGIISDFYDGHLARRLGITTDFGKLIDPLADKILVSSAFISFVQLDPINLPAWMAALIVAREFSVTTLRLNAMRKGIVIPAERQGKQKMISQTTTILIGLIAISWKELTLTFGGSWPVNWDSWIRMGMWILAFFTVVHTIVTGLYYFWSNRTLMDE